MRSHIDAAQLLFNSQTVDSSYTEDNNKLNYRLKLKIDAVQEILEKYTDNLNILNTKPQSFNINFFYKNTDELSKQMRHLHTDISKVYISQQLSLNREEEDNNQQPVSLEYLSSLKSFHAEFVSDLIKILKYDLIILDLRLKPESDANSELPSGISILRFIKSINPYIPILLFTASQNFSNMNAAKRLNNGGAYWIKNVSHANVLRRDIKNILVDPVVHDIYWKSKLILNKDIIEKYVVSNFGTSIAREKINNNDLDVIKKSLKHFADFYLKKNVSIEDFWANAFKLSEARFTVNKLGRLDRPQLIKLLNLDKIEHDFNKRRTQIAAHIGESACNEEKLKEEHELCRKYIDYSIEWFLTYLPYKG
jgi:CheY-like chemotaxis protein